MLYNIVSVSAVQHESASKYTYVPSLLSLLPSPPPHPSRSSQRTELSSLCYSAASHVLSALHIVVYLCQSSSLNLSHPLLPLCPQIHSLCLHLYFYPANRSISPILLQRMHILNSSDTCYQTVLTRFNNILRFYHTTHRVQQFPALFVQ